MRSIFYRSSRCRSKTDVDADAEFQFDSSPHNDRVLELLAAVAASQRGL